jgi:ankyrin repeat protein
MFIVFGLICIDSCRTCSFIESNLSVKPSLSSDEIESHEDCLSLSDDCENAKCAGCRPLHVACGLGLIDIATFLLANSADVHVRTIQRPQTPLQVYQVTEFINLGQVLVLFVATVHGFSLTL